MVPWIGLMVGAYIIVRLAKIVRDEWQRPATESGSNVGILLLSIAAIGVAVVGCIAVWQASGELQGALEATNLLSP